MDEGTTPTEPSGGDNATSPDHFQSTVTAQETSAYVPYGSEWVSGFISAIDASRGGVSLTDVLA